MSWLLTARGCDAFLSPHFARRMAKQYRRSGLDKTAARMVASSSAAESQAQQCSRSAAVSATSRSSCSSAVRRTRSTSSCRLGTDQEAEALLRDAGLEGRAERSHPGHRDRRQCHRRSRRRRPPSGRLLLSRLRAAAGRGRESCAALRRLRYRRATRCPSRARDPEPGVPPDAPGNSTASPILARRCSAYSRTAVSGRRCARPPRARLACRGPRAITERSRDLRSGRTQRGADVLVPPQDVGRVIPVFQRLEPGERLVPERAADTVRGARPRPCSWHSRRRAPTARAPPRSRTPTRSSARRGRRSATSRSR